MRADQNLCDCGEVKTKRSKSCRNCYTPHNLSVYLPSVSVLIDERNSGLSIKDQATKYGSSPNTIRAILRDVGIDTKKMVVDKLGRPKQEGAYITVLVDGSDEMASMRNGNGRVLQHRIIVARSIGRPLTSGETVHHINGDSLDNRLENLQLRQGNHGTGRVATCNECGSCDIVYKELA